MLQLILLLFLGIAAIPVVLVLAFLLYATRMPGRSHSGTLPPLSPPEASIGEDLRRHVRFLSEDIGERHRGAYRKLEASRDYVADKLREMGYEAQLLPYRFGGELFHNVEALLPGTASPERSLVIGAHYDTVPGSPGANDNASGVAVLLELARALQGSRFPSTVRFVAFVNEEPPFFNTGKGMGSVEYVRTLPERGIVVKSMICLETVGYYREEARTQKYPAPLNLFYPSRGDFIAFVGNVHSRSLVHRAIASFRAQGALPSEGISIFDAIPGVSWSDHRSFWHVGIPALMVTDTALFRDPEYHTADDRFERLDYSRMARLITGLQAVIASLARDKGGS